LIGSEASRYRTRKPFNYQNVAAIFEYSDRACQGNCAACFTAMPPGALVSAGVCDTGHAVGTLIAAAGDPYNDRPTPELAP
jgi:hypothetical protein